MAFTPVSGALAKATVQVSGSPVTMPAINWKLDIDPKAKDVSNFRDGRFRKPTLQDSTLSFTLVWDDDAPPNATASGGFVDGAAISVKCYVDEAVTSHYVVPCLITGITVNNEGPEGVIMYDITAMQHNGAITYPT